MMRGVKSDHLQVNQSQTLPLGTDAQAKFEYRKVGKPAWKKLSPSSVFKIDSPSPFCYFIPVFQV